MQQRGLHRPWPAYARPPWARMLAFSHSRVRSFRRRWRDPTRVPYLPSSARLRLRHSYPGPVTDLSSAASSPRMKQEERRDRAANYLSPKWQELVGLSGRRIDPLPFELMTVLSRTGVLMPHLGLAGSGSVTTSNVIKASPRRFEARLIDGRIWRGLFRRRVVLRGGMERLSRRAWRWQAGTQYRVRT